MSENAATPQSGSRRRPWFWRLMADLMALYAVALLWIYYDWHAGTVGLLIAASTSEATRG